MYNEYYKLEEANKYKGPPIGNKKVIPRKIDTNDKTSMSRLLMLSAPNKAPV